MGPIIAPSVVVITAGFAVLLKPLQAIGVSPSDAEPFHGFSSSAVHIRHSPVYLVHDIVVVGDAVVDYVVLIEVCEWVRQGNTDMRL